GVGDGFETGAGRGGDDGRDGPFDEGRVDDQHVGTGMVFQNGAGGQHGAAEIGQDDDTLAAVGAADGVEDAVVAGADPAVVGASGGGEGDRVGADLLHQQAEARSELGAVGHEYDADGCAHEPVP